MNLLEVSDLSKTYAVEAGLFRRRVGAVKALAGVSFSLESGRSLGLVGESGSGKTTLARILAGFLDADGGSVSWEGRPRESYSRNEWASRVQMVFQDPSASLNPKLRVRTQLDEALGQRARWDRTALSGRELKERRVRLLNDVGLPPDAGEAYPHQFSGGQKQRIAIARALAAGPRLLLADEPVSSLDLSVQAQILNLLADLREKFNLAVILISHDLT
ncbi:MAG TPA: dipeptide/oligopeptide/nickel ABC transporter ATP-binding protein, partial [Elusimicrobiota bacterium]|nr:dipeptide/oligopeptide/nickel ABC transporter ATP-binding protein [Elusimicrobiota bacterium]